MNVFQHLLAVRAAQRRVESARGEWRAATSACVSRGRAHPLVLLGMTAGVGLILGRLDVRPWRVRGLGTLLGGRLVEGVAFAVRLLGEFGIAGLGATDRDTASRTGQAGADTDQPTP